MLLSEILNIAKEVKQKKHLNESFKSSLIQRLLFPLINSTKYIRADNIEYNEMFSRFCDIRKYYVSLYVSYYNKDYDFIQYECDNVKKREEIVNTTYIRREKYDKDTLLRLIDKNYRDTIREKKWTHRKTEKEKVLYDYKSSDFLKTLNENIYNKCNKSFNLANIKDEDVEKIYINEARKKPYKNCLQFWTNIDDELIAICLDNKIIMVCNHISDFDYMDVNKSYTGPTDLSDFAHTIDDFIERAFVRVHPHYEIYFDEKTIRTEKNISNVKQLADKSFVFHIYAIKPESISKYDMTETYNSRQDHYAFIKEQRNAVINKILMYREIIAHNKFNNIQSNIQNNVDKVLRICYDIIIETQKDEQSVINKLDSLKINWFNYFKYYAEFPEPVKNLLTEEDYMYLLNISKNDNIDKRHIKNSSLQFDEEHISKGYMLLFVYMQAIINVCVTCIDNIKLYDEAKNNNERDKFVNCIAIINNNYNTLIETIQNNTLYDLLDCMGQFSSTINLNNKNISELLNIKK